jgi:Tfp pilus assembly protein PilO
MVLAGGTTTIDVNTIAAFAQFGLLGVFFVMLISKKFVVPKWTLDTQDENHKRELADKEEAHARELTIKDQQIASLETDKRELKANLDNLQNLTRDQMLPAMIEANRLTAAYVDALARRAGTKDD